jgi:hypothetical protein
MRGRWPELYGRGMRELDRRRVRRRELLVGVLVAAAVLGAVAIVVVFDPLGAIARAIPWPDLPDGALPDLPGWTKWVWRGVVLASIALALVGALEKTSKPAQDESADERGDERVAGEY